MRIIVTAGPTREYLDTVRFITNASSGQMGISVALAAARAGHDVTLLAGPISEAFLDAVRQEAKIALVPFVTVAELGSALAERFESCDALVMAAAVGDFRPERPLPSKLHRKGGPITVRLFPTEDVLASLKSRKRSGQIVVAFAVEDGPQQDIEAKARQELAQKGANFVVLNTPAAMAAANSLACILSADRTLLGWAERPKAKLADEIVALLQARPGAS